mgnify:FL=1
MHVVEDHDEALHHVHRAIGSKKLPFSGIGLVSHPDLLSPNLQVRINYRDKYMNRQMTFMTKKNYTHTQASRSGYCQQFMQAMSTG